MAGLRGTVGTPHFAVTALKGKPLAARGPRSSSERKKEEKGRTVRLTLRHLQPAPRGPFPTRTRAALHPTRSTWRRSSLLAAPHTAEKHREAASQIAQTSSER